MDLREIVHGHKPSASKMARPNNGPPSIAPSSSTSRNTSSRPKPKVRPNFPPTESIHKTPHANLVGSSKGQPVLECDLCKRTFETKDTFDQHNLVFHKRNKVPAKPRPAAFPCPQCGKAFTSPSKMNVHRNATHEKLRPFQCKVCDKSFGYKGDLTKHMATHSGIKAHSCYICGTKFARNFYVKRHIETVHEKKPHSSR